MLVGYCNDCADCRDLRKAPANLTYTLDALRSQTPEPPPTPCPEHAVEVSPDSSPSKYSASSSHEDAESVTSVSIAYAQQVVAAAGQTSTSAADALYMIDELARHRARDERRPFERDARREEIETLQLFDTLEQGHLHGSDIANQPGRSMDYESASLLKDMNGLVLRRIFAHESGAPRDHEADARDALGMMRELERHHSFVQGTAKTDFFKDILGVAPPTSTPRPGRSLTRTAIDSFKKLAGRRLKTSSTSSTIVAEQALPQNARFSGYLESHLQSLETGREPVRANGVQSQMQSAYNARSRSLAGVSQSKQELAHFEAIMSALADESAESDESIEVTNMHMQRSQSTSKPSKLEKFFGEPAAVVADAVAGASASPQRVSVHNNTTKHQFTRSCSTKRFELENYGLSGGREDNLQTARAAGQLVDHTQFVPKIAIMSSTNATQASSSSDKSMHINTPRLHNATSNSRIAEHNARILDAAHGQQQLQVPASARFSSTASYYTDDGSEYRESAFVPPLSLTHAVAATYDAYNADRGSIAVSPPPGIPLPHFNPYHARFDSQGQLEHAAFGAQFDEADRNVPAVQVATMAQFDHVDTTVQPRFMPQVGQFRDRSLSPARQRNSLVGNLTEISKHRLDQTALTMYQQQQEMQALMDRQMREHQAQLHQMQLRMQNQLQQVQLQMQAMAQESQEYANAHHNSVVADQEAQIMDLTADIARCQAETARARADADMADAGLVHATSTSYPNVQLHPAPTGRKGRSISPRRLAFHTICNSTGTAPSSRPAGSSGVVLPGTTFEGVEDYNKRRAAAGLPRWAPVTSAPPTPSWAGFANWADHAYGVDYPTDEE